MNERKSRKPRKTSEIKVRCTATELRRFYKLAEVEGRSLSGEIRHLLHIKANELSVKVEPLYNPDQGRLIE